MGFELLRIGAEHLDDGRGNLLVGDGGVDDFATEAGVGNEKRNRNVVFVEAAVLGNFGAAGEDDAGIDFANDVRRPRILRGFVELVIQRLAGYRPQGARLSTMAGSAGFVPAPDASQRPWLRPWPASSAGRVCARQRPRRDAARVLCAGRS